MPATGDGPVPQAAPTGERDEEARRQERRTRVRLAWVELLVPDARAQDFLQALATGDPDVSVLPPEGTASGPANGGTP